MTSAPFDGTHFRNPGERAGHGGFLRWMLHRRPARWPRWVADETFPAPRPAAADALAATFIGHSTWLLQLGRVAVLTDPIWSMRAGPLGFVGPRRARAAGQPMEALPRIDVVVVSHCHYDHLDLPTLRRICADSSPTAVTGLGNGRHLAKAGLPARELDWWESVAVGGVRITYVPAQHFSARTPFDRNRVLWGGFVIEANGLTAYFAGDTGYGPHFGAIRVACAPIDLALLPIGAYEPRWFMAFHHMNPEEAVRAHLDLGARASVGMHYGTFQLTDEAIDAPVAALAAARERYGVPEEQFRALGFGETVSFRRRTM
jgi:L-ascorbate metabolism protein UlaG (beta-lactamase superfamily)